MGQKEMIVNILPTRTWNRLGMNESQIQIEWPEESVLIKPERLAAGVTWEKEISGKEWDEIQTGMGRTGTLWRCDAEGIVPDIMTFGKAFGGGVMPITGLIFRPEMWSEELVENPYLLGSTTFGGNPVCCAAAIAALDFQLKNDVPGQAREKGAKIKAGLEAIQAKYPTVIKEVRGVGMMMAVEFFSDEYGYEFSKEMYNQHVIISGTLNNSKSIRFEPPVSLTPEEIAKILDASDKAAAKAKEVFGL